jgi:hypothetical protein
MLAPINAGRADRQEGLLRRFLLLALPVAIAFGGWYFHEHYQIEQGPAGISIKLRGSQPAAFQVTRPVHAAASDTIRMATVNLDPLGESKLQQPEMVKVLAQMVRRFDLLAVQGIRADSSDVLAEFVSQINGEGQRYDYILGPRVGPPGRQQQFAFLFNTERIDADREAAYVVDDPDDLLTYEPLSAPFCVHKTYGSNTLTWTAINVLVEGASAQRELPALANVFRAVRDDGRKEDDIIMLGDFRADDDHVQAAVAIPYSTCAIAHTTSNVRHTALTENILFDRRATVEFSGHAGVFDFMRQLNLNMAEALEIGEQLPVYAEFYTGEGARRGRLAAPSPDTRLR